MLIDHDGGWQTQYCHMKKGSIRVREGDAGAVGTPLGEVGLSGMTEFPHVHFTVRHGDTESTVRDRALRQRPTRPAPLPATPARGLWTPDAKAALAYRPPSSSTPASRDAPVEMEQVESGELEACVA